MQSGSFLDSLLNCCAGAVDECDICETASDWCGFQALLGVTAHLNVSDSAPWRNGSSNALDAGPRSALRGGILRMAWKQLAALC